MIARNSGRWRVKPPLAGVKSSARRLGRKAPLGVGLFYVLAVLLWGAALWSVR